MTVSVTTNMLNKHLTIVVRLHQTHRVPLMSQLTLAFFLIGFGLCTAGVATHLYQWLSRQTAEFRIYGRTMLEGLGNLFVTFICGPYLLLKLGLRTDTKGQVSPVNALLSAFLAFTWSFVTGMMLLTTYISVARAGMF